MEISEVITIKGDIFDLVLLFRYGENFGTSAPRPPQCALLKHLPPRGKVFGVLRETIIFSKNDLGLIGEVTIPDAPGPQRNPLSDGFSISASAAFFTKYPQAHNAYCVFPSSVVQ